MSLMVACADPVFEANRDLIEALSRQVFRIGEHPGDGARTKLVDAALFKLLSANRLRPS